MKQTITTQTQKDLMEINSPNLGKLDTLSEYQTLYINNRINEYLKQNKLNIKKSTPINLKVASVENILLSLEEKFELYQIYTNRFFIIGEYFLCEMWWGFDNNNYSGYVVNILAENSKACNNALEEIKKVLEKYLIDTKFIDITVLQYDNGTLKETNFNDPMAVEFNPLAVPYIDDVDNYIAEYLESSAPILVLHGEPGTGKSTFTKYLLSKVKEKILSTDPHCRALYSFDENVFFTPEFFHQLLYESYDVVILEDFNQIIHKNSDDDNGVNPLHKFLSTTDGLITRDKKIIISTNITSPSQIHPALTRPGRCHDLVHFRNLEKVEIDDLCDDCAQDMQLQIESINVSEFYARCNGVKHNNSIRSNIGF